MKDALGLISGWLNDITNVLKALIGLGVAIEILFGDMFGVIAGIGSLMAQFGDAGIAGLMWRDLRREATSRLFERGLSITEVQSITGHAGLEILTTYTNHPAEILAEKLKN